jgi:hypothetical protein
MSYLVTNIVGTINSHLYLFCKDNFVFFYNRMTLLDPDLRPTADELLEDKIFDNFRKYLE